VGVLETAAPCQVGQGAPRRRAPIERAGEDRFEEGRFARAVVAHDRDETGATVRKLPKVDVDVAKRADAVGAGA
jgi:hypothetical protein